MAPPRPKQAQTLPADGIILEELIATMQSEYGTPTTPQEYRLILRVPTAEEVAQRQASVRRIDDVASGTSVRKRLKRRRRGRRSSRLESGAGESVDSVQEETVSDESVGEDEYEDDYGRLTAPEIPTEPEDLEELPPA